MHLLLVVILGPQSHADAAGGVLDGGDIKDHFTGRIFSAVLHNLKSSSEIFRSGQEAATDITARREGGLDVDDFVVGDIDDGIGVFAHG